MGDARHVLIDDEPLIELRGGVVRSRSDELPRTFLGLVGRLLTHERQQDLVRVPPYEVGDTSLRVNARDGTHRESSR